MPEGKGNERIERKPAKPLSVRGRLREAGETVELREDQIAWLTPLGYFALEPAGRPGGRSDSGKDGGKT